MLNTVKTIKNTIAVANNATPQGRVLTGDF